MQEKDKKAVSYPALTNMCTSFFHSSRAEFSSSTFCALLKNPNYVLQSRTTKFMPYANMVDLRHHSFPLQPEIHNFPFRTMEERKCCGMQQV